MHQANNANPGAMEAAGQLHGGRGEEARRAYQRPSMDLGWQEGEGRVPADLPSPYHRAPTPDRSAGLAADRPSNSSRLTAVPYNRQSSLNHYHQPPTNQPTNTNRHSNTTP